MSLIFYVILYFIIGAILVGIAKGLLGIEDGDEDFDIGVELGFVTFWPIILVIAIGVGTYYLCTRGVAWLVRKAIEKIKDKIKQDSASKETRSEEVKEYAHKSRIRLG